MRIVIEEEETRCMNGIKRENIQPGLNRKNIRSYFKVPINNASVEDLNNKAKIISRRAYGFRSVRSHILNLYHCLADPPWPKMVHTFV